MVSSTLFADLVYKTRDTNVEDKYRTVLVVRSGIEQKKIPLIDTKTMTHWYPFNDVEVE